MDRDLIVCCHHVSLGEDGTSETLVGVVMDMMDLGAVRYGPGVECSLMLEISELAAWAGTHNDVTSSSRRLSRHSTRRPKWERKWTLMTGCVTSATTNRHMKSWHSPRLRLRDNHL
jgi:hypothetical protein